MLDYWFQNISHNWSQKEQNVKVLVLWLVVTVVTRVIVAYKIFDLVKRVIHCCKICVCFYTDNFLTASVQWDYLFGWLMPRG